jgi:MoaE-MoaD fusion protein
MKIRIRYFAIVRELLGRSDEVREVGDATTAGELYDLIAVDAPRIAGLKRSVMLMVNQEYVPASHPLQDGDELALIPPVSGGDGAFQHFEVTTDPLDARAIEQMVASPENGAILTFTGTVRDNARGKGVTALDYEAYPPAAEKMLERIGDEMRDQWGIERVAIVHRYGLLQIGEASVVISVASPHRDEAFAACRHAIERIKEIVPIWKKEHYDDGAVWIGSEADYQREIGRLPVES